jgi:hypothetical protein
MTKTDFDILIKQNLISSGVSENAFTYKFDDRREYPEYYTKSDFDVFIEEMKVNYPQHYLKFKGNSKATSNKGGVGGELAERNSRYGLMPPKMASVASSSRFCYLALRDGINISFENCKISSDNVEFEKECKILSNSLTSPQLDAFISDSDCNIYIEAKCHEIFDSHKAKFKNKYWECFEIDEAFSKILKHAEKGEKEFVLPLSLFDINKNSTRFDIKQFVCHLFGIAEQNKNKNAKLVYMFFNPITGDADKAEQIEDVFKDLTEEIKVIFKCDVIKSFCKRKNIELIAIAEKSEIMQSISNDNLDIIYSELL